MVNIKHPNGYLPKINYWQDQWLMYARERDTRGMEMAEAKLTYFCKRQEEVYGGEHKPVDYIMGKHNIG